MNWRLSTALSSPAPAGEVSRASVTEGGLRGVAGETSPARANTKALAHSIQGTVVRRGYTIIPDTARLIGPAICLYLLVGSAYVTIADWIGGSSHSGEPANFGEFVVYVGMVIFMSVVGIGLLKFLPSELKLRYKYHSLIKVLQVVLAASAFITALGLVLNWLDVTGGATS